MPRKSKRRCNRRWPGARPSRSWATAPNAPSAGRRKPTSPSTCPRSVALRAGGARALGQSRHAARRDRNATRRQRPAARIRADGLLRRPRRGCRARHHRRRASGKRFRSAPAQEWCRAGPFPWRFRGVRSRRKLQIRRTGGEERHRLRSMQADGRLLGHPGCDDRRDDKSAAPLRDRTNAAGSRPRPGAGGRGHDQRHGIVLRRLGRRASAGGGCRAHAGARERRRRRHGATARRVFALGDRAQAHARGADATVRRVRHRG